MKSPSSEDRVEFPLQGLVGRSPRRLLQALGSPEAQRGQGPERWLVYRRPGLVLRVRCVAAGGVSPVGGEPPEAGQGAPPRGNGLDPPGAGASGLDGGFRVASWTVAYDPGAQTLEEALAPLGLWPVGVPDVAAAELEAPMVRLPLPDPDADVVHSLTASVRGGAFRQVAAFDEPPEWT